MASDVDYDELGEALRRAGASWNAAQAHGLISGRLAVSGAGAIPLSLGVILENSDPANALRKECEVLLINCMQSTHQQLSERLSRFMPLLPDDQEATEKRTEALANWSEGFLHGLVSGRSEQKLKVRLAAEPIADIIKDMLQITRAETDPDADDDSEEEAYVEVVEYLRVAAQLVYEELAELRAESEQ
jgi:hypothetical protein